MGYLKRNHFKLSYCIYSPHFKIYTHLSRQAIFFRQKASILINNIHYCLSIILDSLIFLEHNHLLHSLIFLICYPAFKCHFKHTAQVFIELRFYVRGKIHCQLIVVVTGRLRKVWLSITSGNGYFCRVLLLLASSLATASNA